MSSFFRPRPGRGFRRAMRGVVLLASVALSQGGSTAQAVNNGPQAYYFNATGFSTQGTVNGSFWNFSVGAPITGVIVYDNRANPNIFPPVPDEGYVDVTDTTTTSNPSYGGNYPSQWSGQDRRYLVPSQTEYLVDTDMDGTADTTIFQRGLSGFNYVNSDGIIFRRRASTPTSQTSPMQIKAVNDVPFAPGVLGDSYSVSDNMKLEATGDGRNGATIDLVFIDVIGPGASLADKSVLPSLDLADYQPGGGNYNGSPWGIVADGNVWLIAIPDAPAAANQNLHAIPFGDTNGSGKATAGDFAALAANYLKPAGTYGGGMNHPVGIAIWTDGDYNVDGLVNHTDYKMFVNPGSVVAGLPRNFLDGDVNFDGKVDIFDVNAVSANWAGTTSPSGDANLDGAIDIFDVNTISAHWGAMGFGPGGAAEGGGASVVPEPAGLLLLALAGLGVVCAARRRARP